MAENGLPGNAPDVAQSFTDTAGDTGPTLNAGSNVTSTASAEIDVALETKDALTRHDNRWRQLSDRLSNRPLAEPSLDMDTVPVRSIAKEHTEHRRQWQAQRDAIETKAITATAAVRAQGTTLTREFGTVAESDSPDRAASAEPSTHRTKEADRFQREFSVKSTDIAQSRDR